MKWIWAVVSISGEERSLGCSLSTPLCSAQGPSGAERAKYRQQLLSLLLDSALKPWAHPPCFTSKSISSSSSYHYRGFLLFFTALVWLLTRSGNKTSAFILLSHCGPTTCRTVHFPHYRVSPLKGGHLVYLHLQGHHCAWPTILNWIHNF